MSGTVAFREELRDTLSLLLPVLPTKLTAEESPLASQYFLPPKGEGHQESRKRIFGRDNWRQNWFAGLGPGPHHSSPGSKQGAGRGGAVSWALVPAR